MELYEQGIHKLLQHPKTKEWPELKTACESALGHRPVAWHFPLVACEAVGASPEAGLPALSAITCSHMAIMLVDDMLDDDPRGAYHRLGTGRAANLAAGLYGLGLDVLLSSTCPQNEQAAAVFAQLMLRTAYGQDLDVHNAQTEEGYWTVTRAKSSPYFVAALTIGAMCGGGDAAALAGLTRFGELYGEIMQIHDDLNDSLASPANVDWEQGRAPLPLLFAQTVSHPDRERFIELRGQVSELAKLEEAQAILVRSGAISYSVNELLTRHERASRLVAEMPIAKHQPLLYLLEESVAPVRHLFAKVGAKLQI